MDVIEKPMALKLSQKDSYGINTSEVSLQGNHTKLQNCLMGKIVAQRIINIEAFRKTMKKVWKFFRGLVI